LISAILPAILAPWATMQVRFRTVPVPTSLRAK
jgi:hypothetical protein